jgi:hypothetical protein
MCLLKHFFKVSFYLEARIRILIRIRIKMTSSMRIRIEVMLIRNTAFNYEGRKNYDIYLSIYASEVLYLGICIIRSQ